MKKTAFCFMLFLLVLTIFITPSLDWKKALGNASTEVFERTPIATASTEVPTLEEVKELVISATPVARNTKTPLPTPTEISFFDFYGCHLELKFVSGPLEKQETSLYILGEDYFQDKGDKFKVGKNTGVYYKNSRYLVLHSGYENGNILKPLEAEFIRKYLENWGNEKPEYVLNKISDLKNSEVVWICDGTPVLKTKVTGAVRLSHMSSEELWLNPEKIETIIMEKQGLSQEWLGKINLSQSDKYIGFCGWAPKGEENRYSYFRYVIGFEILEEYYR